MNVEYFSKHVSDVGKKSAKKSAIFLKTKEWHMLEHGLSIVLWHFVWAEDQLLSQNINLSEVL